MTGTGVADWVCCHLGAREHYAIPRALQRRQRLRALATDAWATPGGVWTQIPGVIGKKLAERYSAELASAEVVDFTDSLLLHELRWRVEGRSGWPLAMARNQWFQERAANVIDRVPVDDGRSIHVFAHSYAALEPFRIARERGFKTVLGQIDGGEEHFKIVATLARQWPEYGPAPQAPPDCYFEAWREECALADAIVVNSDWSRDLLVRAGIPHEKLQVVPLAYEPERGERAFTRSYPTTFSIDRPLRVLYVGTAAVFKGLPELLDAMALVKDRPIQLTHIGDVLATIPARFQSHPRIRWAGSVSRSDVMEFYRQSDVLVFPSHSDGFGMAQIEAQGWQLPVIASRNCGRVVQDGVNGLLLDDVSASSIAQALTRVQAEPELLAQFARQSPLTGVMGIDALGAALLNHD